MTAAARVEYSEALYLSFELGWAEWKLAFTVGLGQKPRLKTIEAGDMEGLQMEIRRAKERFGLAAEARVVSCYEAGRDGFWLHRFLLAHGIDNRVVDSASIEIPRRRRRAKTDRLDATKLVMMLVRWELGDERVWRYQERFGDGRRRIRRVGIVALARKLLIALWRYLEFGVIPEGAVLKA